MFTDLVEKRAYDFGLVKIFNMHMLEKITQTAFSWTNTPNSICLATNKQYFLQANKNPNIIAIVANPSAADLIETQKSLIICEKESEFFYYLHNMKIHKIAGCPEYTVSKSVAESAFIEKTAIISENVSIGKNVVISPGCIIMDNTIIEDEVVIGPKCVIGADGFFSKYIYGRKEHLKHFGGVRIRRGCKLHSDITVSKSVNYSEFTEIGDDVHIGHKSVIGHDCKIGKNTDISAMALIAGRVTIGANCWIGANASISNACIIGDDASIKIGAVVITDVQERCEVSGNFAIPHRKKMAKFVREGYRIDEC